MNTNIVHTEHVGSLLRPASLLEARARAGVHEADQGELRDAENAAIRDALAMQRQAGVEVFTDGEFRRGSWKAHFWEAMSGVVNVPESASPRSEWHNLPEGVEQEDLRLESVAVSERLGRKVLLTETEADFMRLESPGQFKITMPSPSMALDLYRAGFTDAVYPSPAEMIRDVIDLQIDEIRSLIARGVTWFQLDSIRYSKYLDADTQRDLAASGIDVEAAIGEFVGFDNTVIRAAKATDPTITVGVHICRGNNRSAWISRGGYDLVAEQVFGGVEADRFLLEYDDERSGDFRPLHHVGERAVVVLGLVSSKTPNLESQDELLARIEQASAYVPMERLALSPQCGFASTVEGNMLTIDDQRRKLELVAATAARAWN